MLGLFCSVIARINRLVVSLSRFSNRNRFLHAGITYGENLTVEGWVYLDIHKMADVTIGHNFTLLSGLGLNPLCRNLRGSIRVRKNAVLKIGDGVGMSSPCLWAKTRIEIGDNVFVGGNVIIMDNDAHSLDWNLRRSSDFEDDLPLHANKAATAPIIIGDDVMIGANTIILKGVHIGARSVIGAGSVVSKSIPSDCVAAGNPCKVIRQLS